MLKIATGLLAALMIVPMPTAAYESGAVSNGGSITGTISFKGAAPAPKKLDVNKDKEVCAKAPKSDP